MTEAQPAPDTKPDADNTHSDSFTTAKANTEETEQEAEEAFQRLLDEMDEELRCMRRELRRIKDRGGRGPLWLVGLPMSDL